MGAPSSAAAAAAGARPCMCRCGRLPPPPSSANLSAAAWRELPIPSAGLLVEAWPCDSRLSSPSPWPQSEAIPGGKLVAGRGPRPLRAAAGWRVDLALAATTGAVGASSPLPCGRCWRTGAACGRAAALPLPPLSELLPSVGLYGGMGACTAPLPLPSEAPACAGGEGRAAPYASGIAGAARMPLPKAMIGLLLPAETLVGVPAAAPGLDAAAGWPFCAAGAATAAAWALAVGPLPTSGCRRPATAASSKYAPLPLPLTGRAAVRPYAGIGLCPQPSPFAMACEPLACAEGEDGNASPASAAASAMLPLLPLPPALPAACGLLLLAAATAWTQDARTGWRIGRRLPPAMACPAGRPCLPCSAAAAGSMPLPPPRGHVVEAAAAVADPPPPMLVTAVSTACGLRLQQAAWQQAAWLPPQAACRVTWRPHACRRLQQLLCRVWPAWSMHGAGRGVAQ